MAICAYQLREHQEAIEYINLAINLAPDNPLYLAQFAQFLFTDNFELACELFKKALKLSESQANDSDDSEKHQSSHKISRSFATLLYNQACLEAKGINKQDQINAINIFKQSLEYNPYNYKAYYNIACCYFNLDDLASGVEYIQRTLEINPDHSDSHFALSQFYQQNNIDQGQMAEHHLQKALEYKTLNLAAANYNYGVLEHQRGNYSQAIEHYQKSLEIHPESFAAAYNLGSVYQKLRDHQKAIEYYTQASRINPNNETCKYLIASLKSGLNLDLNLEHNPNQAPTEYIETLFDSYAKNFEDELINQLNYKTPELLYNLFIKYNKKNNLNILDLGCGTGLIGQNFKPVTKTITGVDISQNMLGYAEQKNIYTKLVKSDIEQYLLSYSNSNSKFKFNLDSEKIDLIILADVLVYYGDLTSIFNNIHNNLAESGYLLFSLESLESESESESENYRLNNTGRYTHNWNYVKRILEPHYSVIVVKSTILRTQGEQQVSGVICLARKNIIQEAHL
ncbi:MAG: tetratricopeptide repeat protein [Gammaproteobacteria bacterium]|nr:tetratricopeptide repeat protein [Gammaproteobacteria bacterium]